MNKVDFLLENPFYRLSEETKISVIKQGPHHPEFREVQKIHMKTFNREWYQKKPWLTVSEHRRSVFCFVCLLFGGESTWTLSGVGDMNNFAERVKNHEITSTHIRNIVKYKLFGRVNFFMKRTEKHKTKQHKQVENNNRNYFSKIVNCLLFCVGQGIGVGSKPRFALSDSHCGENETHGGFECLVRVIGTVDAQFDNFLSDPSNIQRYMSLEVQNDLLNCAFEIFREVLQQELQRAMFVCVQLNMLQNSYDHVAITLRYVCETRPVEHFIGIIELRDCPIEETSKLVLAALEPYKLENSLVFLARDSALSEIDKFCQDVYPKLCVVDSYTYELRSMLEQACLQIRPVWMFYEELKEFSFLFLPYSIFLELFNKVHSEQHPGSEPPSWDFENKPVRCIYQNKAVLLSSLLKVNEGSDWTCAYISKAHWLTHYFEDEDFLFFLEFLSKIETEIEKSEHRLFVTSDEILDIFCSSVLSIKEDLVNTSSELSKVAGASEKRKTAYQVNSAIQCCDNLVRVMRDRFSAKDHVNCLSLVEPTKIRGLDMIPNDLYNCSTYYPFLSKEKLRNELQAVRDSEELKQLTSVTELYSVFLEYDLADAFSETLILMNLALTCPLATTDTERCTDTLKRLKDWHKGIMESARSSFWDMDKVAQNKLNAVAVLFIEKNFISSKEDFVDRVIDKFAVKQNMESILLVK